MIKPIPASVDTSLPTGCPKDWARPASDGRRSSGEIALEKTRLQGKGAPVNMLLTFSRYKCQGFTLIELLFAVSLLGILIAGASHSFGETMTRKQLVSAAQAIEQEIQLARRETKKRDADLVVSFTTGTSWCLGVDTGSCDCNTALDCSVRELTAADFSDRVTLNAANFSGIPSVTLQRIRGVASASGEVKLQTTSGLDLSVRLLATGRTRLCSPSDNVIGYPKC